MMKRTLCAFFLFIVFCSLSASAVTLSADDLLPPAHGKTAERAELKKIQNPEAVSVQKDVTLNATVVKAATLQDAVNTFATKNQQGCAAIPWGNGITFVAVGHGGYSTSGRNPMQLRIDHRTAYVVAFANAKAEMAKTVGGIVQSIGISNFASRLDSSANDSESTASMDISFSEGVEQSAHKVLKGFVTWSTHDDGQGNVYVSIVSSPKSRGNYARPTAGSISAASINDGLNAVLAEIQNNLVPPVGGRIVTVPGSGEVAFVGFGSAVVRKSSNPELRVNLELQAEQAAGLRAADALIGCLTGDDTTWRGRVDETTRKSLSEYDRWTANDPSVGGSESEVKAIENSRTATYSALTQSSSVSSLRSGVLPPGTIRRSWTDDDHYFAYGLAVYLPSASDLAAAGAKEMDETKILQDHSRPSVLNTVPPASVPAVNKPALSKEDLGLKRGPSGVVRQDL